MTQPTREEALAHFGVKGMRWGVRKDRVTTSTTYQNGKVVAVTKTKGPYPKTDAERKRFIEDFAKNNPKVANPNYSQTAAHILTRNGKQLLTSQVMIGALAVPALILTAPATAAAAPPAAFMAIWSGAQIASLLSTSVAGTKTVAELIGNRVSKKRESK